MYQLKTAIYRYIDNILMKPTRFRDHIHMTGWLHGSARGISKIISKSNVLDATKNFHHSRSVGHKFRSKAGLKQIRDIIDLFVFILLYINTYIMSKKTREEAETEQPIAESLSTLI